MTTKPPHRFRRWLRFSVRGLLLLTVVVAVWFAWQVNRAHRQRKAIAAVKELGGRYWYEYQFVDGEFDPDAPPASPRWLLDVFGDEYFLTVTGIVLADKQLSASHWELLSSLTELEHANFSASNITDEDLDRLKAFRSLKTLHLTGTGITDRGLAHLAELRELEELYLTGCSEITDEGLQQLRPLSKLTWLGVTNTQVTTTGASELRRMRPRLQIVLETPQFDNPAYSAD